LISPLLRKAFRDITRRKGRAALMVAGICLGVAGVTAITEATSVLGGAFFYSTDAASAPNITIAVDTLPDTLATTLQHLPNVARLQVRTVYANAPWTLPHDGGVTSIQLNAYADTTNIALGDFQLTGGHLPGPGEVVMDGSDHTIAPLALDDTVTVGTLDGHAVSLHVVGFARTRGGGLWHSHAQAIAYMSQDGIAQFAPTHGAAGVLPLSKGPPQFFGSEILVRTQDVGSVRQTAATITQTLQSENVRVLDTQARIADADADSQLTVSGLLGLMRALAIVAALLTGILIFNTIATLLTEQTAIIGAMKALGGTRWRIGWSYLTTVGIAAILGTALGVDIGLLAGYQLASQLGAVVQQDPGPMEAAPLAILAGAAVGLLVPLLASLPPLWNATRIPVREAMAAYGVRTSASASGRHLGRSSSWAPQLVWLGLRNLLRRPGRTALTAVTLTLACAIFMAAQVINASLGATLDQGFATLSFHSDLRIRLDEPAATTQAISALSALPNVKYVDAIDDTLVSIAHGELDLYGLSAQTPLYQPHLVAGRWLRPGERGALIINDAAANRLGLVVGENVSVELFVAQANEAHQAEWQIVGIVHDVTAVDGSANPQGRQGLAFATLESLNQLRGLPSDAAERLWLQARDQSSPALTTLRGQAQQTLRALGLGRNLDIQLTQDDLSAFGPLPTIYGLFDAMAILVALVGLLGLAHAVATAVLERRLEIGILRSLGATGWRVGLVFWTEGLALVVLAWVGGALLGLPAGVAGLSFLGTFFGPFDLSIHPEFALTTLLLAIGIACMASAIPTVSASRLRVREALRYE
jgi:putative ABC transport system permease protein